MTSTPLRVTHATLLLLPLLSLSAGQAVAGDNYLKRLSPVVLLRFDQKPGSPVELPDGAVLDRPAAFADTQAVRVDGPRSWTGGGWDFSKCDGPYLLMVDEAMARVGDIEATDGMTVSFWCRGTYSGRHSRIMTGPFDIGSQSGGHGIWGGTNDYQNAQMERGFKVWDGQWHHVAVVADFRSNRNNVRIYLDGKVAGTRHAVYTKGTASGVGRTWAFGARNAADPGFDYGSLADIAVFDRTLSDHEILYIGAGPVYAGRDREVVLPNTVRFDGFAPAGESLTWSQEDGPATATVVSPEKQSTEVRFSEPGQYRFTLASAGVSSSVQVKVIANQPPLVLAGDGMVLSQHVRRLRLQGTASDSSIARNRSLRCHWSCVSAPEGGRVTFDKSDDLETEATFDGTGLFTLRLAATDGELTATSDMSVLVDGRRAVSYLRLLNPLFLHGCERPAKRTEDARADDMGHTGYLLRFPEHGLPRLIEGARPFTGYGWDMSASDCDVRVINGDHLRHLYGQELQGRSVSFWIRGDEDTPPGNITDFIGLIRIHRGYGLNVDTQGLESMSALVGPEVLDGKWHHIALVVTTQDGEVNRMLYLDAREVARATRPIPTPWWTLGSPAIRHSKFIGSRGRSGSDNFAGELDDFAVFAHALSADDIAYIVNGPSAEEEALLAAVGGLEVDAGPDRRIRLPGKYRVALEGHVKGHAGLTPRWRKVSGNGTVQFDHPDRERTNVSFAPVETDKDREYSKFVLRLALVNRRGHEVAGDDVTVLFHPARAPAIRALSKTPPAGEHPRVFFMREDLPELRHKAAEVAVARRAFLAMRTRAERRSNPNDATGSLVDAILDGESFSIEPAYGGNAGGFFLALAEGAYVAWIGEDGVSDTAALERLADAFSGACKESLTWYSPNHQNALCHDINWAVGLAYDLLYDWMDAVGRKDARRLISRMTRFRNSVGAYGLPQDNSTNWKGYHDHLLPAALAIEGEPGYDPHVIASTERKNSVFMTQYGIFDSGLPHEGYAYYTFGMTWMAPACYAIARRSECENLMETTRFYRSIETAFRLLDRDGIRSHHDVVEDATSGAGLVNLPPRHVLLAKYLWPEDRMVDYLWKTLSRNLLADEDRRFGVFEAILGEDVAYPEQTLAEAAAGIEPVMFCPDRGVVLARDRWDEEAVRLDFRCRMDKYHLGHQHSDVNAFELWGKDRMWIIDRGKFGGTVQEAQSCVLIDGVSAFSAGRNSWPSTPGRFVEFHDDHRAMIACGDAKPFFEWSFNPPENAPRVEVKEHGVMWSDYYFPRDGEEMPAWMAYSPITLNGYGQVTPLYKMNPVQRAYRTAVMLKGEHPAVVIIDDYQKDDQPHDYLWMANVPFKEEMVVVSRDATSLVLRHKEDADGPLLLVKVLHAAGLADGIRLNRTPYKVGKDVIPSERIEIPCSKVIAPDYRVLLYPFDAGDPAAVVDVDAERITIRIGKQQHSLHLERVDGRSKVTLR